MQNQVGPWVLCFAILAGGAAVSQEATAGVIMKEKTKFYSVTGTNGREIFKSMLDKGPKLGKKNEHALATTEYDYNIKNVQAEIRNGRCIPTHVDVEVTVLYTYPKWKGSSKANRNVRKAWKEFSKSVVWHEKQHVKIAMEYAKDYEKALKKIRLRTKDNCTKASFGSIWRASRAALKHNRKQRQFDRRDLRPGGRGYEAQLNLIKAN